MMRYFLFIQTNSDLQKNGDQNVVNFKVFMKETFPPTLNFSNLSRFIYEINQEQYERIDIFKKMCEMTKKDFFIANEIEELLI